MPALVDAPAPGRAGTPTAWMVCAGWDGQHHFMQGLGSDRQHVLRHQQNVGTAGSTATLTSKLWLCTTQIKAVADLQGQADGCNSFNMVDMVAMVLQGQSKHTGALGAMPQRCPRTGAAYPSMCACGVLHCRSSRYNIPMYITETGIADARDDRRHLYIDSYFKAVRVGQG